jgi:UDP-N-acetyl-D-mannosaminuronate dehydrogenase
VKIAIIGQGYVGYTLSIAATKAGHFVMGFDTNSKIIDQQIVKMILKIKMLT